MYCDLSSIVLHCIKGLKCCRRYYKQHLDWAYSEIDVLHIFPVMHAAPLGFKLMKPFLCCFFIGADGTGPLWSLPLCCLFCGFLLTDHFSCWGWGGLCCHFVLLEYRQSTFHTPVEPAVMLKDTLRHGQGQKGFQPVCGDEDTSHEPGSWQHHTCALYLILL